MKVSFGIKIIGLTLLVSGLFACKKLLKEHNPSGVTAETVYNTKPGFESLVVGAYSYSKSWYGKEEGVVISEAGTDLWTAGSETMVASSGVAQDNRFLITYQNLSSVNQNIARVWKQLYAAVNLCNAGVKIGEANGFDVGRIAELKFLRAFYYWHIVETWGGVHFTTEPTNKAVTTANRTSVETFYDLIISDLKFATKNLKATNDYGRVNRYAAQAFLARVFLTRGMNVEAKAYADSVITNSPYVLVNNYSDLWDANSAKQKACTENIWSINYSSDANTYDTYNETTNPYGYGYDILSASGSPTNNRGNNNLHPVFIATYDRALSEFGGTAIMKRDVRYGWPFNRLKPTRFLLNLYDETKDERYKGSFQTTWKLNFAVTKAGNKLVGKKPYVDTALVITKNPQTSPNYYTVNVYDTYNADGSSTDLTKNLLYPALWKFQDSTRVATAGNTASELGNGKITGAKDVYIIRLAELYLISAEASLNLGNTQDAADKINVLRTKRAINGKEAEMQIAAGDVTLDFILDERAREFAGENIRWFDLKRTGKLVSRVKQYNPDLAGNISDFHVLRPIPLSQIDAVTNKQEFTQNPGY